VVADHAALFRIFSDASAFEGFVDKFTGDGGMALSARDAHEDHGSALLRGPPSS